MKKLLSLILILCLALAALPALGDTSALSREEINAWRSTLLKDSLKDNAYTVTEETGMFLLHFGYYTLAANTRTLGANTTIYAVSFNELPDQDNTPADIRGLRPGDLIKDLLAAWPNENPTLSGTREEAVLYITGDLPGQAAVGYVARDGQDAQYIVHKCYDTATDGVHVTEVTYTLDFGMIASSYTDFSGEVLSLAEARRELSEYAELFADKSYSAYMSSLMNGEAEPFGADDLIFSGLDFFRLTPESAVSVLGDEYAEDWLEDGDTWLHVMEWNAATLTFIHDKDRNPLQIDSLYMDEDTLEGPRHLRVGDTVDNVLNRFLYAATDPDASPVVLYGAENDASYATMETFISGTSEIRYYCADEDGHSAMLLLYIEGGLLQSITVQML